MNRVQFDAEHRDTPAWANWEAKQSHHFAIDANGRLYPVKQILAMASGQPVSSFAIFLTGLPDAPESRPHSRFNQDRW